MQRRVGIDAQLVSAEEASEIAGGMSVDDVGAVAWEPDSGYADPLRTTASLVEAAKRSGVTYRPDVAVSGIARDGSGWRVETSAGPILAGKVLVAAGVRTVALLGEQGVDLPVTFVRHTVAVMRRPDGRPAAPIVSDRIAGSYYRPTDDGETLVGSTGAYEGLAEAEPNGDPWPQAHALRMLSERYSARFADAGRADVVGGYTSVYDCTPDLMPLLGGVPGLDGLSVAVGFSGHGFKIAPAVGDLLADDLLEVAESDVARFRLSRFEEGEAFVPPHPYSVPTLG
jgi:glycine/D-amino acid oxidase-like deaminating enzyme